MASELAKLFDPVAVARAKKGAIDPKKDEQALHRAGAIGMLFNILGRTGGASAEAVNALVDKDPSTTFGGGIKEGLLGRADVSYSDVLGNLGVENRYAKSIGGFVGDVALDPLTYIGVKKFKGVSETDALLQAARSGSDDVAGEASRIMAESPTRVGLTVAGTPFSSGRKVASIPVGKSRIAEKLLGPVEDRKLGARMFSREAELPLGLNEMSRVIDNSHNAQFTQFDAKLKQLYKGLDPDEKAAIYHALDTGVDLKSTPVKYEDKTRFANLGEYVEASRKLSDEMFVDEAELGLFTRVRDGREPRAFKEYRDNYVYRFYRKPPVDELESGFTQVPNSIGGSERSGFQKKRTADVTAAEAKEMGWDPIEDIQEVMMLRASKHFRSQAAGTMIRDSIDRFGLSADEFAKLPKGQVKDMGWVPASKVAGPVAQKMGDRYVPEFVARSLNQAWDTFKGKTTGSEVLKLHDKVMQNWKFLNTSVLPGYVVRSSMGDTLLNAADGVWNPARYTQAMKVLRDRDMINERSLRASIGQPLDDLVAGENNIKVAGKNLPTSQVLDLYYQSGAKSGFIPSEVATSMSNLEKRTIGNRLSNAKAKVGDVSEKREDFFRLAHFIDALGDEYKSGKGKLDWNQAAEKAGQRVRKYNIDYGNLSSFEQNVMRRVIPFYSFMRRATPLNMELLFTKPGFMAMYPKGQDLMQGLLGTEDADGEMLVPQWIREMAPVRLALGKQEERNAAQALFGMRGGAGQGEAAFLNFAGETGGIAPLGALAAPVGAANELVQGNPGGVLRELINPIQAGYTPLAKLPIEMGTNRSLFTGAEITDKPSWAINSILGGYGRVADKGFTDGNRSSITSNLLGLPIQSSTHSRQEGEWMQRSKARNAANSRLKESALRQRFSNWDSFSEAKKEKLTQGLQLRPSANDAILKKQRRYLTQILGQ